MLSREDNELLTRVGPGTAMGGLMRRYWLPVLQSTELEAGGRVKRVMLLGERLIAYRAKNGTPGLIAEFCPHRRAFSLDRFFRRFYTVYRPPAPGPTDRSIAPVAMTSTVFGDLASFLPVRRLLCECDVLR